MGTPIGTVTIYSTRGGNGKTITSLMLAIAAAKRNLKAVVIDADLEAPSLMHLLHPQKVAPTWVDYLEEYVNDITELPQKTNIPNLEVIYSPTPQVGKNFLGWKSKAWWQQALKRSMIAEQELHQAGYDFVVLDNQSGTSLNSVNNMVLADASVMVIRPATYGVGAAENFIGEMYRVLRNMKPRKDFYMWNQVQIPKSEQEKDILNNFLTTWDNNMEKHGLIYGGRVNFNLTLNLALLGEVTDFSKYFSEVAGPINELLDLLIPKG
jgi:MinD-like ATPase involved in chromosome partitioning or flagellar assembly